jgi:hypothetical protein
VLPLVRDCLHDAHENITDCKTFFNKYGRPFILNLNYDFNIIDPEIPKTDKLTYSRPIEGHAQI